MNPGWLVFGGLMWILALGWAMHDESAEIEKLMLHNKAQHLALAAQEIYGMPASRPVQILWNEDPDWDSSAEANCRDWSMTLSLPSAKSHTDAMLNKVISHEYGHFVHCFLYGDVGIEPHGPRWEDIVRNLGGDPSFK